MKTLSTAALAAIALWTIAGSAPSGAQEIIMSKEQLIGLHSSTRARTRARETEIAAMARAAYYPRGDRHADSKMGRQLSPATDMRLECLPPLCAIARNRYAIVARCGPA
jgi:hypothetical protein